MSSKRLQTLSHLLKSHNQDHVASMVTEGFQTSWQRCVEQYHLNKEGCPEIKMLREAELKLLREQYGHDEYMYAIDELNELMFSINNFGYSASLANQNGVILAESLPSSLIWHCESDKLGTIWTEEYGGTNGIGTALAEERAVAIYHDDHFFSQYCHQACAAAPFFSPLGHVAGVINLTTRNPHVDVMTHNLVTQLALKGSVHLEERMFRRHFRNYFMVRIQAFSSHPLLLAVDRHGFIFGASYTVRKLLDLKDDDFGVKRLHDYFDEKAVTGQLARGEHHTEWYLNQDDSFVSVKLHEPLASGGLPGDFSRQVTTSLKRNLVTEKVEKSALDRCAGKDQIMHKNIQLIRKVIDKGLPILLLGETGAGKDTIAKAIHTESARRDKNFIAFNCASVPESLIDSELFGYNRGAFTGAVKEGSQGRLVEADGGTLFLDEIGDMPLILQTRLLRVLETGEVSPLGAGKTRHVDIEIIAATNQKLQQRVADGTFREDLFYRLSGVIITVPPLRERSDLNFLIDTFLADFADGRTIRIDPIAKHQLMTHSWPGNIRELRHVLRRGVLLCEDDYITPDDLAIEANMECSTRQFPVEDKAVSIVSNIPVKNAVACAEIEAIKQALAQTEGNVVKAANILGMAKATLYRRLKSYNIN